MKKTLAGFSLAFLLSFFFTCCQEIDSKSFVPDKKKPVSETPNPDPEKPDPEIPDPEIPDPEIPDPEDPEPDVKFAISVSPGIIALSDRIQGDNNNRQLVDIIIANIGTEPTGPLTVAITGGDASRFEFNNNAKNKVVPGLKANGLAVGESLIPPCETTLDLASIGIRIVGSRHPVGNYSAAVSITGDNGIDESIPVSVSVVAAGNYTVTFNINGGTGTAPDPQTAYTGTSITLPDGSGFSKTGYVFDGWNTSESGTGTSYNAGANFIIRGNAILYAVWISNNVAPITYQPVNTGDIVSPFIASGINPDATSRTNLNNSVLGVQVDGPSATSSFTGYAWDDERQNNIRVLDNRNKAISPHVGENGIFEFYLHNSKDYDGGNTDRQRIEIKGSTSTTQGTNFKGYHNDIVTYFWKFRLPENVVTVTPAGFYHVFQIKATQGNEAGSPLITFSVSSSELQFRQVTIGANMDTAQTIAKTPISNAAGKWLAAEVTLHYRDNGYLFIKLTDVRSGTVLMNAAKACDLWRRPEVLQGGTYVESAQAAVANQLNRPKWGLYRKLDSKTQEATMMWADMVMIKRNIANYRFPDGYNPNTGSFGD